MNDQTTTQMNNVPPCSYWQNTQRLTLWLSAIWLVVTFCTVFFARDLYGFKLFGWPVSFYMAAQGILLIYVAIVGVYAWRMRKLDQQPNERASDE
jgi:putative solute:sodium symporter small subunit